MQYLLQILHLSCQVQCLPGYQATWSVLLRNRMAERLLLPIINYYLLMYNKTIIRFLHDIMNYQNLVSDNTDLGFDNS